MRYTERCEEQGLHRTCNACDDCEAKGPWHPVGVDPAHLAVCEGFTPVLDGRLSRLRCTACALAVWSARMRIWRVMDLPFELKAVAVQEIMIVVSESTDTHVSPAGRSASEPRVLRPREGTHVSYHESLDDASEAAQVMLWRRRDQLEATIAQAKADLVAVVARVGELARAVAAVHESSAATAPNL